MLILVPAILPAQTTWSYDQCVQYAKDHNISLQQARLSAESSLLNLESAQAQAQSRRASEASESGAYIMVKSEYKLVQIPVASILYVEGLKDYVKIYLEGQDKSVMTLMSMKQIEKRLPESKFLRVHRSYIVNTSKITVIERNRILFGKTAVPVSDSYKAAFSEYISGRLISNTKNDNDSAASSDSEEE